MRQRTARRGAAADPRAQWACELLALGDLAATDATVADFLSATAQRIANILGADLCRIVGPSPDSATPVVRAVAKRGAARRIAAAALRSLPARSRFFRTMARRRALLIGATNRTPAAFRATLRRFRMRSGLAVALPVKQNPQALIEVYRAREPAFGPGEACIVESAAALLGLALSHERAEAERAATEKWFRTLIENSADGVAAIAANGRFLYNSPAAARILGYPHQALRGRSSFDFAHPAEIRTLRASLMRFTATPGATLHLRMRWRHQNGSWRWIESMNRNLLGEPGVDAIVSNYRDVTEKREAEEALHRSEEMWRTLVANAPNFILILDRRGTVRFVNRGVPGIAARDAVGTNVYRFVAPADRRTVRAAFERILRTKQTVSIETQARGSRGHWAWYRLHAGPIARDARADGVVVIASDVTEEKRLRDEARTTNERLKQQTTQLSQTVTRLNRYVEWERSIQRELRNSRARLRTLSIRLLSIQEAERTRLAREVHDELGQNLTAIKMEIELMRRHCATRSTVCRLPVFRAVELIDTTIDTVRRIARGLRPGALDDLGLIPAVEGYVHDFMERSGIRCTLETPADEPPLDGAVATTVFRILQEALTNVARHAQATRVGVHLEAERGTLRLTVRDNGRGLAPQDASHPHSLGLIGIGERAHLCGGRVRFTAKPGHGTVVRVDLPLHPKP